MRRRSTLAGPDLVWVGLSTPKQERWMAAHVGRLDAPVMLGVGAAFDVHAGLASEAPTWVQRSGFEWLYRLVQEPRRLVAAVSGQQPTIPRRRSSDTRRCWSTAWTASWPPTPVGRLRCRATDGADPTAGSWARHDQVPRRARRRWHTTVRITSSKVGEGLAGHDRRGLAECRNRSMAAPSLRAVSSGCAHLDHLSEATACSGRPARPAHPGAARRPACSSPAPRPPPGPPPRAGRDAPGRRHRRWPGADAPSGPGRTARPDRRGRGPGRRRSNLAASGPSP